MKTPIDFDDFSEKRPALVQIWEGSIGRHKGFVAAVRVLVESPEGPKIVVQYAVAQDRQAAANQASVIGVHMGARTFALVPGFNMAFRGILPVA